MTEMKMDMWKYYDITHRHHVLCNAMSEVKFDRLIGMLRLAPGARVVEIASGKAEFIIRLAERYGVEAVGVDMSPHFVADARKKLAERLPDSSMELIEMNGADYAPDQPHSFDLAACIGASWIWQGHRGTLEAMIRLVAPGGWVVVGEPYWRCDPAGEYLAAIGERRDTFGTHVQNIAVAEELGLQPLFALASNLDDWDQYEGLQWYATEEYARNHPDDPDLPELLARVARERNSYLRWGRDTMGWAIYVFRQPSN